jgi:HlyD family secretion protein
MPQKTRVLITIAAASMLLAACSQIRLPGQGGGRPTNSVTASAQRVTVEKAVIENRVIGTGRIVARTTIDVPFMRAGLVTEVMIKEGDLVKKGDVLAQLDTSDLKLAARQQWSNYLSAQLSYSQTIKGPSAAEMKAAQAALASAQAAYADLSAPPSDEDIRAAQADLQNAEAALRQAQAAYDRRAGRDPGVGASSEALSLEQATNNYAKAKATYDAKFTKASKAQFASAAAQIANAQKNIEALTPQAEAIELARIKMDQAYLTWQQAEADIKEAALVAPADGLVVALNTAAGEMAGSGSAAVQLADFAEPLFEVSLDEADLSSVKLGQEARVRLQAYINQSVAAVVDSIASVGTDSNNIVTYRVRMRIPRTAGQPLILLNMSGTSEIITGRIEDALLAPTSALIVDSANKTYAVFKATGAADPQRVEVTIGARSGDRTQILTGVSAGDTLAIPTVATQSVTGGGGPPPGP